MDRHDLDFWVDCFGKAGFQWIAQRIMDWIGRGAVAHLTIFFADARKCIAGALFSFFRTIAAAQLV